MKSKQSKGVIFNTHCFDLLDIKRLCELFESEFQLKAWPRKQVKKQKDGQGIKESYQIYISGHSYEQLRSLIYPHLIPEMLYKFPPQRVEKTHRSKKISRLTQLPKE